MAPLKSTKTTVSTANKVKHSPRSWDALTPPLSDWILDAVSSMGFVQMTPVQASTIPLFMTHKDVVVEAVTGSGKTLAFLIPVVEKLLHLEEPIKKHHVGAIIVSPTRELAAQTYNVLSSLLAFHPSSAGDMQLNNNNEETVLDETSLVSQPPSNFSASIIPQLVLGDSQSSPAEDVRTFLRQSSNVLVGTPGRLAAILSSPYVHCPQTSFEMLVLDEADRLLDLGFKEDLGRILNRAPKQRRTGLFSASVTEAVDEIVRVGLRNPVKIAVKVKGAPGVEDKRTPASLQMSYLVTPQTHKFPALQKLLTSIDPNPQKTIVYFATCAQVDYFQHLLRPLLAGQFGVVPLHGKYPPKIREKNFSLFSNSTKPSILLTTDVAARGLDIPSVDIVVQIDPPSDPKVFLHRCGRAGRAGRKGLSVVFLLPGKEEEYVPFLSVRKTPITRLEDPAISLSKADIDRYAEAFVNTVMQDRDLHDRGQRAFVSWVQSYSKHQARTIFPLRSLDWQDQGIAWGLLKLPRMPELKGYEGHIGLGRDIVIQSVPYKDQVREKKRRQQEMHEPSDRTDDLHHGRIISRMDKGSSTTTTTTTSMPWSRSKEAQQEREKKRSKKSRRKEKERLGKLSEADRKLEEETAHMIAQVRRQNESKKSSSRTARDDDGDEFNGFD